MGGLREGAKSSGGCDRGRPDDMRIFHEGAAHRWELLSFMDAYGFYYYVHANKCRRVVKEGSGTKEGGVREKRNSGMGEDAGYVSVRGQ